MSSRAIRRLRQGQEGGDVIRIRADQKEGEGDGEEGAIGRAPPPQRANPFALVS